MDYGKARAVGRVILLQLPSALILALILGLGALACNDEPRQSTYTLVRSSRYAPNGKRIPDRTPPRRILVATFDAGDEDDESNEENCELARNAIQSQPGAHYYNCESGE